MGKNRDRKTTAGDVLWWIVLIIAIGTLIFSAYKAIPLFLEYKEGTDEYNDLQQYMSVSVPDIKGEPDVAVVEGEVVVEAEPEPGPSIDFAALRAVNEDVVGWLYIEALEDINYPIVQGQDNDYYLHRTVKQTYNFAGSIFLEMTNKPDFSDPHSVVFGHNMKNGSMFGQLNQFRKAEVYNKSRYLWICTPDKNYKYEIFSVQEVFSDGEEYTLFSGPSPDLVDYVKRMEQQSEVAFPEIEVNEDSKILTLSTCTTNTIKRLIVQAIRVN
jgi:sortase, SrtB family